MNTSSRALQNRALLGVLLMLLGMALYPLCDAFTKHMMGTYSVHQATFMRALSRLVPLCITVCLQRNFSAVFQTSHPRRHLVRLGVNLAYTFSFMYAMKAASLTTVYTIAYTSPFFMILLSAWILKERASKEKWLAVAIGMIGTMIACPPTKGVFQWVALLVLFGTGLGALNKILMRRLASTEHSLAIAIYPNIAMLLVMGPFLLNGWQPMPWSDWTLFGVVGIITAAGQYAIAQSLRFASASTLAPIDYSSFFWVVMLDFFWWHTTPALSMVIGAAVIVASNFYILYISRKESLAKKQAA